jgi:hypothetical protein
MTMHRTWEIGGCEPSITDLLSDPIAKALMRADGIGENVVIGIIRGLNAHPAIRHDRRPIDSTLARYCQRLAAGSLPQRVTEELAALACEFDPEAADF